ncbi:MAG: cell wall-binding repeat-containing protein [Anaerosomatales bacterium]|nr:cell wall-binding repeat-containing protein [Anaerosomatales bacterium]
MAGSWRKTAAIVAVVALMAALAVPSTGIAATSAKHAPAKALTPAAVYAADAYEPDDSTATAHVYNPAVDGNTWTSARTFHGTYDGVDDGGDWVKITIDATGTPIWVETEYVSGQYDTTLYLYDSEGTQVAYSDDHPFWSDSYSSAVYYDSTVPGDYYVEADPYDFDSPAFAYKLHITVGDARRVWGANRYATAAAVSKLMWDNTTNPWYGTGYGPGCIVVASGTNPADALAGGVLASMLDGIVLLTNPTSLSPEAAAEIQRVSESLRWAGDPTQYPVKVYVLGGPGAVSDAVVTQIEALENVDEVERLAGGNRFETAVAIADELSQETMIGTTAFLVNGYAWADALAAAPVASYASAPVLMTNVASVPQSTLDWLEDWGVTDIYIVGGTGVVSDDVVTQLEGEGYSVERVSGDNRYETAVALAQLGIEEFEMDGNVATLVSGETFADALAAAPISWWTSGPLLLTKNASLSPEVIDHFVDYWGWIGEEEWSGCYVIGGPGAVSGTTYAQFRDLWKTANVGK